MSERVDIEVVSVEDCMAYFRSKVLESENVRTATSMRQALASLDKIVQGKTIGFEDFNGCFLDQWASSLFSDGYSVKTVAYYLKLISSLYGKAVKEGVAPKTSVFSDLRAKLLDGTAEDFVIDGSLLEKLRNLVAWSDSGAKEGKQLAVDIAVFGFLAGGLTADDLINYKKDEYDAEIPLMKKIVERYSRPRNKYLFPLEQGVLTPNQLRRKLQNLLSEAFALARIAINIDNETCARLWAGIAVIVCGIEPGEAAACMRNLPEDINFLRFSQPCEVDAQTRQEIIEKVYRTVCDTYPRWFAMRLRPSKKFNELEARFSDFSSDVRPELYYPSEEIARRVGHKIVKETKPVIPGLVFFRTGPQNVKPMMKEAGDLCWTYRNDAGYTVIPDAQMREFRMAVGTLNPATEIHTEGSIELRPGDTVQILAGSLVGKQGTISSIKTNNTESEGRTICRLSIPDSNGIEWIVSTPSSLLQKI